MTQQETHINLTLDSNEAVWIRRLSPFATQSLLDKANEIYPSPDVKKYEFPLSEIASNAMPGMMVSGEESEQYQKDLTAAKIKQNKWFNAAIIGAGVVVDTPEGREATITRYGERIATLRVLTYLPEDPWLATVMYGLITTWEDRNRIAAIASGTLTGKEISAALRMFR